MKWIEIIGKVLGIVAGVIAAGWDFYHFYDEYNKGHFGLALANSLSGAAGVWLICALMSTSLPVIGSIIAIGLLIGTAIYLAFNSRDNIQKWLVQCLWRRIPVSTNDTKEDQELYRERETADLPIWPDITMEMNELKLALEAGN